MKDNRNYTISNKWIMRHDPYYFDTYSLYNIETRTLVKITPALFAFLSVFYHKAISYSTLYEYFISKGITLK